MTFAAIGFGMALPYLVLSAAPKLVQKMPHSGPHSTLIKQVMGLFMLAAAAYFIGSGISAVLVSPPNPPGRWYWWIVMGLVASAGVWMAWRTWQMTRKRITRATFAVLGILIVSVSAMGAHHFTDPGPVAWIHYTPERFQKALSQNKAVVMVFTAEWCLNCKALEQSVLKSDAVVAGLNEDDVAAIKVDITGHNPDGQIRLSATGVLTIPLLVIYDSEGREVFKSDFYTPEQVLEALSRARGAL
jgi:thiol:disulfide interchange protein DsbD